MSSESIQDRIARYEWYHAVPVGGNISTGPVDTRMIFLWDFILKCMRNTDFVDKRVLDVGCRDGLFSFEAEKAGAKEVIGIDNNVSIGAIELLIPWLKSSVKMQELNVYDLDRDTFGAFDIVMFYGVLYHLRYPFLGLRRLADCIVPGGTLLIESGMLECPALEEAELLYCPHEKNSPYESTSVTFFNRAGLCAAMSSFGLEYVRHWDPIEKPAAVEGQSESFGKAFELPKPLTVNRQFLVFRKTTTDPERFEDHYWYGTHRYHTNKKSA